MIGWIYQSEKTVIKGDFEVVESTNDYSKDLAEVLFANQDKLMDHTRRQQFFGSFTSSCKRKTFVERHSRGDTKF
ncbi:hypothetical protein [Enterococcus hirae]|uniref:hypothetical protein n=1 Tax=Enterococcus hirae TaxID=1354 RepID=UPI0037B5800B